VVIIDEEPRAAVIARLDTPAGRYTVANTHLSFVPGWNRAQLRRLIRDLRGFDGPRVLMGDLNMAPPAPTRWTGLRSLAQAATFPAEAPERQLDHILTDDVTLRVDSCSAPRMSISDHRAPLPTFGPDPVAFGRARHLHESTELFTGLDAPRQWCG
jgi:endonuclease/exonuclease/phosphatase family metal-dependent hydrolase